MSKIKLKIVIIVLSLCFFSNIVYADSNVNTEENNIGLKYEYAITLCKAMGLTEEIMQDYNVNSDNGFASEFLVPTELKYFEKYLYAIKECSQYDEGLCKDFKFGLSAGNSTYDIYPILHTELCFINIPFSDDNIVDNVIEISKKNDLIAKDGDIVLPFTIENADKYFQGFLNKNVYYYFDESGNIQVNNSKNFTYADLYCERNRIKDKSKLTYDYISNNSNSYATRGDAIIMIAKSIGVNDKMLKEENNIEGSSNPVRDAYLMDDNRGYATLLKGKVLFGDSKHKNTGISAMPERKITAEEIYTLMLRCLAPIDYDIKECAVYYNLLSSSDRWYNNLNQIITLDELNIINERFLDNKVYYCFIDKITDEVENFDEFYDYIIYNYDCSYRNLEKSENKVVDVSVSNLVKTPEKFNGKKVRVEGYGNISNETSVLYDYLDNFKEESKISVELNFDYNKLKIPYADLLKMNDKFVVIEGIFNYDNKDNLDVFSGSIEKLSYFELYKRLS